MTCYHFNIRNGSGFIPDEEGRELAGLEAAREEGVKGARSLLAGEVLEGKLDLRGTIEIVDGDGGGVLTIRFDEAVAIWR